MADSRLRQLTPRVWWFTPDERSDRPSLGAILGDDATMIVDAGASRAHAQAFLDALAPMRPPPIAGVALTHWHWDHSFGACAYGAPVVALRETAAEVAYQASLAWDDASLDARVAAGAELAFCAEMLRVEYPGLSGIEITVPDVLFDDEYRVDLGEVSCRLIHVGGDHASDSVIALVPEEGVVFLSDCLYHRLYAPVEHHTVAGVRDLVGRLRSLRGVTYAIEGHGDAPLDVVGFAGRLAGLESAAERVARLGEAAVQTAVDDDDRETIELLLAGVSMDT